MISLIIAMFLLLGNPQAPQTTPPYVYVESVESYVQEEVAAQEVATIEIDEEDWYWLARIVSAEAKGESQEGQIAVANVVLNRVQNSWYPNTIKEVIFQAGQFCPVGNGSIHNEPTPEAWESARLALLGHDMVEDSTVVFFYNPKGTSQTNWIRTREVVQEIGGHLFASSRGATRGR